MKLTKHWAAQLDDYVIDLGWSPDGSPARRRLGRRPDHRSSPPADGARRHELPGHEGGTNACRLAPAAAAPGDGRPGRRGQALGRGRRPARRAQRHSGAAGSSTSPGGPRGRARPLGSPRPRAASSSSSTPTRRCATPFPDAPKTISALAWQPGGGCARRRLLRRRSGCGTPTISCSRRSLPYANGIHALAWSPDGRWLVSGNQDPSVHLWIPQEDIELHMSGYEGKVRHLSFDLRAAGSPRAAGATPASGTARAPGPEGREPAMLPHDAPVCAVGLPETPRPPRDRLRRTAA